jgi:hypothetical protein
MLLRTAKSCGPDAPTLASSSRKACRPYRVRTSYISADDGGKRARSPGRARNKPLKPLRAGMPGDPGGPVATTRVHYHLRTRGYGCNGHPAFPTPSRGREINATTRAPRAARSRSRIRNYSNVIASAAKQSIPPHKERMDCFAALAMPVSGRARHALSRHRPPPGRRIAPPDDRLRRAIQYSRDADDRTEKPRRAGYSALAEYDEHRGKRSEDHPSSPHNRSAPPLLPPPGIVVMLSANPDAFERRKNDQGRGRRP